MTFRYVVGLVVAFSIGAVCRVAGVPVPAPPALVGALLVVALSSGYVFAGVVRTRRGLDV